MLLKLDTLDTYQRTHQFVYRFNELETGFEFLNNVVSSGSTLISVDLIEIEENYRISLPIEAFDGITFSSALKQLELEWVSILDTFSRPKSLDLESTVWHQEKLGFYEQKIISLELLIGEVDRYCEGLEAPYRVKSEAVTTRYQSMLRLYEAQLRQAHSMRSMLLNRLKNRYNI